MQQTKFSMAESQIEFLNKHRYFGFKDKSSMARAAVEVLRKKLEMENLKRSADLYAEIYENDSELHELTESALSDWLQ